MHALLITSQAPSPILFSSEPGISVLGRHPGRRLLKRKLKGFWLFMDPSNTTQRWGFAVHCNCCWAQPLPIQREVARWEGPHHSTARMIRGSEGLTGETRLKDFNIYHLSELWLEQRGKWLMNPHWLWSSQPAGLTDSSQARRCCLWESKEGDWEVWNVASTDPCWCSQWCSVFLLNFWVRD